MIMQTHTEAPKAVLSTVLCWLLTAFFTKRQMYWKT